MKLTKGNELSAQARREVLAAFVHRLTSENGYPARNPCGATIPAISDAQWLDEHAFYVRADGNLSKEHKYAEPVYMAK